MIKKYFGTDGIRGKVNGSKINGEMFFKFGLAAGTYFKNLKNISPLILEPFTLPLIPSVPKYFLIIANFVIL